MKRKKIISFNAIDTERKLYEFQLEGNDESQNKYRPLLPIFEKPEWYIGKHLSIKSEIEKGVETTKIVIE